MMPEWLQLEAVFPALFGALFGAIFGSFLNVVRVRMPEGESIVRPRSRCMRCGQSLRWWQNLPLVSWLLLRGRCHFCHAKISPAYPLVELAVTVLWACCAMAAMASGGTIAMQMAQAVAMAIFCWMMILLAALDWEHLWLPDRITWPAIGLGLLWQWLRAALAPQAPSLLRRELLRSVKLPVSHETALLMAALAALVGAGMVLGIRLAYWLVRRREGMGLGDAKLMAALGAWLGFTAMLDAFLAAVLGAFLAALAWLVVVRWRKSRETWGSLPLPLGTFLALAAVAEIFHPAWLWRDWMSLF